MSKTPGDRPQPRLDSAVSESGEDRSNDTTELPIQQIGPYRLESYLGAGGMGAVYRAFDERLQRPVALKQILPDAAGDPRVKARFRREARAAARLEHPGIVRVHDILETDVCEWIVMEFLEGKTLDIILKSGPLAAVQVVSLGADIAAALAAAHNAGIVHRDLKTSNVLVIPADPSDASRPAGRAKILDFGLAKRVRSDETSNSISEAGQLVGTPHAMSPEQASGYTVDWRSDLFSLGTMLYEMLTAISPFRGENIVDTLMRVCRHKQLPPRDVAPETPEILNNLVEQLLEKRAAQRPQSAADVASILRHLAAEALVARTVPHVLPPYAGGEHDDRETRNSLDNLETGDFDKPFMNQLLPRRPRNPFYHRRGITDPRYFYGRSGMVRGIIDMIASGQSCAIVGERRIGKSSLLAYLGHPEIQKIYGLVPAKTLAPVVDFLGLHSATPEELWRELLEALETTASDEETRNTLAKTLVSDEISFTSFRRTLKSLRRRGIRVALLCDEFELAVQNPKLDQGFFGALRSLAGHAGVVFVTATRLNLLELEQYKSDELRQKVLGSPFFNIFAEFRLGPFEKHEAAELLACALEQTSMRFDRNDVSWLIRMAGYQPYFLQLAAYHLYDYYERQKRSSGQNLTPVDDYKEPTNVLRDEAAKIFRNQWQHSDEDQRRALAALAVMAQGGKARQRFENRVLQRLERRALALRIVVVDSAPEGSGLRHYQIFSELFAEWIISEVTLSMTEPVELMEVREEPKRVTAAPSERYTILEEVGHGGTGTVFRAWDERLYRLVAIKVLDSVLRATPQHMEKLLAEARTCASLHHPNIVVIYDIDDENGQLVEEFMAGGSLRDLLESVPVLVDEDVHRLARELASALGKAHEAGIIHRDLKPENVLLTSQPPIHITEKSPILPAVKLGDFGTALRLSDSRSSGERRSAAGTLAYMAPEQIVGERVGPASDFFALGMLLYEARHGGRPVPARAEAEARAVAKDALGEVIARCLATDPRQRYREAGEILEVLEA